MANYHTPNPYITSYTPDGVETYFDRNNLNDSHNAELFNVNSNAEIWKSISSNTQDPNNPYAVSSVYETQMRYNMQMARLEYAENKNSPQAIDYARRYQEERKAYMDYMSAMRNGYIYTQEPVHTPYNLEDNRQEYDYSYNPFAYSYSPDGMSGVSVENGRSSSSVFTYTDPQFTHSQFYTPENPLRVTPEYEQRMLEQKNQATSILSQLPQSNSTNNQNQITKFLEDNIKYTSDAYLAFRQAKKDGCVVVSPEAKLSVPDLNVWYQRQQHHKWTSEHNEPITGSSHTGWRIDPNRPRHRNVDELSADLFNRNSQLKSKSVSSYYLQTLGSRVENHALGVAYTISRNVYSVMQSGEDNSLRTFETARNYTAVSLALGSAAVHAAPVLRAAHSEMAHAKQEFKMFGNLTDLNNKELATNISEHRKLAKATKREIKELTGKHQELLSQIRILEEKGSFRTAAENKTLQSLLEKKDLTHNEILNLTKSHAKNSMDLRREIGLQKVRYKNELEVSLAKELRSEHAWGVTQKHISKKSAEIQNAANARMAEKFNDPIIIGNKKIKLHQVSDSSLTKEIKGLEKQARDLKHQIKALEKKGSALTSAERLKHSVLKNKHAELSMTLRKYKGLQLERAKLKDKLDALSSYSKRMGKNLRGRGGTYNSLRSLIFKPIEEGSEIGARGLTKVTYLTNPHVRALVKKSIKLGYISGRAVANIMVPGSVQAIDASIYATKQIIKTNANVAINTTKSAIKTGVKSTARFSKRVVVRATPRRVRNAVSRSYSASIASKRRFTELLMRGKKGFADTTIGRGIQLTRFAFHNTSAAIRAALAVIKSIALKVGGIFALIFLIIGLISVCAPTITSSSATTIILSPYETDDDKISLIPYVNILQSKEKEFYLQFLNSETKEEYEDIIIDSRTNSLSNFREIISMTAVYCDQNLNLGTNPKVKKYLESLYDDSHYYTQKEEFFKCAAEDCETKKCEGENCQTKKCETEDCKYRIAYRPCDNNCPDDCTGKHKIKIWYCPGDHPYCPGDHPYCPGEHKRLKVYVSALGFDEIFSADSMGSRGFTASSGSKIGNFTISYYCGENYPHICNDGTADTTATGTKPKANRTIAVDPDVIPLGSHVIINGKEYIAEDTGGAIQSNRIDIFVNTHQEALNKGMDYNVPVYWASYTDDSKQDTDEWSGWTDDNIEWAKNLYSPNWSDLYDVALGGDLVVVGDFVWPLSNTYRVTCGFGPRVHPVNGGYDFHSAVDLGVAEGSNVYAATDGVVTDAAYNSGSGNYVKLRYTGDDGTVIDTYYLHNSQLFVAKGETVKAGDVIALSGNTGMSTGPHLHFAFIVNGEPQDPLRIYDLNNIEID